jgi:hypothetical protein
MKKKSSIVPRKQIESVQFSAKRSAINARAKKPKKFIFQTALGKVTVEAKTSAGVQIDIQNDLVPLVKGGIKEEPAVIDMTVSGTRITVHL